MEALWVDLSSEEEQVESPGWHQESLQETDQRFRAGKESLVDWPDAKRELRKRFE